MAGSGHLAALFVTSLARWPVRLRLRMRATRSCCCCQLAAARRVAGGLGAAVEDGREDGGRDGGTGVGNISVGRGDVGICVLPF